MSGERRMEMPALLVIDMVKDNFDRKKNLSITPQAEKTIEPINRIRKMFKGNGRRTALFPLLRVLSSGDLISELEIGSR